MSNNSLYSHNSEWLSSIKDFAEVVDKNLGSELDPSPNRKGSTVNEKVRGRFSFENRVDQSLKRLTGFDAMFAMTEAMVTYTMQIARMSGADEWETEELKDRLAVAARKTLADPEKAPLPFIIPEMYEILHQKTVVEPVFNEVIALHQKMQESDRRVAEHRIKAYTDHRERLEKEQIALFANLSKFDLKSDIEYREACDRESTELMEKVSARLMAIATAHPGKSVAEAQAIADADPELIGLNQMLALVETRRHLGSPVNEEARAAVRRHDAISSEIAQIDATIQGLAESMAELGSRPN